MKLNGIFPPIPTPYNHSGDIYRAKIRTNLDKWNLTNLAGYVVGSCPFLTPAEKPLFWEEVAKHTPSTKILIADVSYESVRESVAQANLAADLGYRAAYVTAPSYNPVLYFQTVADQSRLPLIIEGPGPFDHPNIIASCGAANSGLPFLTSDAAHLAADLRAGAVGAILPYAAAAPFSCITIFEANMKREYEAADDWQNRILVAAQLVTEKYGLPGLLYAMDFNGYYGGPPRLPLVPLSRLAQLEIESAFHNLRG
jgi:4-hydroxy-2-oxoglutarate aldolase